jgi:hypothetical protein
MSKTLSLKPKVQKQVDTLIAEREKPSRPALVSQALILCPLPYRKPKDTILERVTKTPGGNITVSFAATRKGVSLPFGNDAVLLDLLCSEARRKKTREITFERAKELLELLELEDTTSGRSYQRIRERLVRLAAVVITVSRAQTGFNVRLVDSWDFSSPKETRKEAQGATRLFPYAIRFSQEFFEDLMSYYVPIPERVLVAFKSNPTEYNLMKRITHRALVSRSVSVIPWDELRKELGNRDSNPWRFKADVRKVLKKLTLAWEDMPLTFAEGKTGLEVHPRRVRVIHPVDTPREGNAQNTCG